MRCKSCNTEMKHDPDLELCLTCLDIALHPDLIPIPYKTDGTLQVWYALEHQTIQQEIEDISNDEQE
jgi:hypothetical protein